MDTKKQLLQEKTNLLNQIVKFARLGKSQEVLTVGERLNKVETIISRYEKLLIDISDLFSEPLKNTPVDSKDKMVNDPKILNMAPGRGYGKTLRMLFLKKLSEKGIHLENIKGSIYKSQSGHKIGIAVATERNPDRWFLGLPLNGFDNAVLLCKPEEGDIIEICLPKNFFDEYGNKMSQSAGQLKFNLARRGSGYVILVPGTGGVNVSKFQRDYSVLQ